MNDNQLEFAALVHETVSATRMVSQAIEKLATTNREAYIVPQETLVALQSILDNNARLITRLFEENQQIIEETNDFIKHLRK